MCTQGGRPPSDAVQDDGIGGAEISKGSGLIGLKDRVESLGGTIRLLSPRGGGTSLHVTIPLNVETNCGSDHGPLLVDNAGTPLATADLILFENYDVGLLGHDVTSSFCTRLTGLADPPARRRVGNAVGCAVWPLPEAVWGKTVGGGYRVRCRLLTPLS